MKALRGWGIVALWGFLLPNLALAAAGRLVEACESQAKAKFQRRAVEVELASIKGDSSEVEVVSARESLLSGLEKDRAHCIRLAAVRRSVATAGSVTF